MTSTQGSRDLGVTMPQGTLVWRGSADSLGPRTRQSVLVPAASQPQQQLPGALASRPAHSLQSPTPGGNSSPAGVFSGCLLLSLRGFTCPRAPAASTVPLCV